MSCHFLVQRIKPGSALQADSVRDLNDNQLLFPGTACAARWEPVLAVGVWVFVLMCVCLCLSLAVQGLGLASDVASLWTAVTSRISLWLPGCGLRRGLRRSASLSRLTAGVWMPIPRCDPKGTQRKIQ